MIRFSDRQLVYAIYFLAVILIFVMGLYGCAGSTQYRMEQYAIDEMGLYHKLDKGQVIAADVPVVLRCRDKRTGRFTEAKNCARNDQMPVEPVHGTVTIPSQAVEDDLRKRGIDPANGGGGGTVWPDLEAKAISPDKESQIHKASCEIEAIQNDLDSQSPNEAKTK